MRFSLLRSSQSDEVEAMYREHAPGLLAYARSFGLDRAAAQDVLHQVFLRLLEDCKQPDEPRPYLFRAIRNTALNQQRSGRREAPIADEPWFYPSHTNAIRELDLRRAMQTLPPEQTEVLIMHLWGGLSFQEIAEVTVTSPNTAASRYRYALTALRRTMRTEMEAR